MESDQQQTSEPRSVQKANSYRYENVLIGVKRETKKVALRISLPTLDQRLVRIHVALCFLSDGKLTYVEYCGDVFLGK